jgi:hypothetical protein
MSVGNPILKSGGLAMTMHWFVLDGFPTAPRRVFRLDYSKPMHGERWCPDSEMWVPSERPSREYYLGPDSLTEIAESEVRKLLPPQAFFGPQNGKAAPRLVAKWTMAYKGL